MKYKQEYSEACQATWTSSEALPNSTHYIEDVRRKKYGAAVVPVNEYQRHYADMAPEKRLKFVPVPSRQGETENVLILCRCKLASSAASIGY